MNTKRLQSYLLNVIAVCLIYAVVMLLSGTGVFNRYWQGIIINVCIAATMAVSLNLTTGMLGQLALGHAGFMSVGAYAAALFTIHTNLDPNSIFPVSLLIGGLAAAVFGVIIGIPALRLKGDYLAIITLGFGEIIRVIITNLPFTGGARGLRGIPRITTFSYVYIVMVLVVVAMFTLGRSRHGRAILSIREDPVAAEAAGIPTTYYKIFAFTLAAFFAGVAGGLFAHYVGVLDPKNFAFTKSIEYLVMVVLGGMGSITGAIGAAAVLTLLPEVLRSFNDFRMLVYALALILMMLFRPMGLLGNAEFSLSTLLKHAGEWCGERARRMAARSQDKAEARYAARAAKKTIEESPETQKPTLLKVEGLGIQFGGLKAVEGVQFELNPGEIVGLIGPNGAGKTTVFNLLTSVYRPTNGAILVEGKSIVGLPTHSITQVGIARTFQNIRLFKNLTVFDNVKIAYHNEMQCTPLESALRLPRYWHEEKMAEARARELLHVFGMEHLGDKQAKNLPYGQQRKLEIARALSASPKILLLDEPAAGMNPTETQELMDTIRLIRDRFNVAILLIEHDMQLVMGICERIVVLNYGQIIATGTPDQVRTNPEVVSAYLGA